jgi:serine/threonine-protein kinase
LGRRYVADEIIVDKYRLAAPLGEGGMGAVWTAQNLALDALVAIKLIRNDVDVPGAAERLLTEARAAARLRHPGIVRVFDFGATQHGDPFIVMELLTGESLGNVLEREGRLPALTAVQLLLPICEALHVAHQQGIVHRDIKPENFFLAEGDGRLQPKVLDFGIAKVEQVSRGKVTQAGTILGSPDYMSPEQARGDEGVDFRADIWAFCVVLYECVTGSVPFEDPNYNALLRKIIEQPPTPTLEFGAGDDSLWHIILRGLGKKPEERWPNMRELGVALAQWLLSHGVTEDACGQSLRSNWTEPRVSMHDVVLSNTLRQALKKSFPPSDLATIPPPTSSPPSEGGTRAAMAVSGQRLTMTAAGRRIALIAAGAAALVLLIVVVVLSSRSTPPTSEQTAASAAAAPKAAAPTASPQVPATTPVPQADQPAAASLAASSKLDEASGTAREHAAKRQRAAAPSAAQSAAPKARPKTYDDFGF